MRKLSCLSMCLALVVVWGCGDTTSDEGNNPGTNYTLSVVRAGTGTGTVTSGGIACGGVCSQSVASGTTVALVAAPVGASTFVSWAGCDSDSGTVCTVTMNADKTVVATFNAANTIKIEADITTPTTWTAGNIYEVTKGIRVTAPLTILPGVQVLFDAGASLDVTGTINADGQSATTPIVFTSAKVPPNGGGWDGIKLRASGSVFNQCQVLYAGGSDSPALTIGNGFSATVTNCTFAHHKTPTDDLNAAPALDASNAAAGTLIKDNLFFDNRAPLALNTTFNVESNMFDNSAAAPSNPQPNKYNAVLIRGCAGVTGSIAWPALRVPYVIGERTSACKYVNIDANAQLTIGSADATAVVKFFSGGVITANGAIVAHAMFTSINDDANGGDTNGNGTATVPAPRDWNGVRVNVAQSKFENCQFLYGNGNGDPVLAIRDGMAVTVTGSTFAHNRNAQENVDSSPALRAQGAAAGSQIANNTFFDNTVPLSVSTDISLDDSNAFLGAVGGAQVGNTFQGVVIKGCGAIRSNITWSLIKVPLLIGEPSSACKYVNVDPGANLALADGVIVKFFAGGAMTVAGTLTAKATSQVVFTAFADDEHGGDTNADATATTPAAGDWRGIWLKTSGSAFEKVKFLYGGGATTGQDDSVLAVQGAKSVSVKDCLFAHNAPSKDTLTAAATLDLSNAAAPGTAVTGNRFYGNRVPLKINVDLSLDDSNSFDSGIAGDLQPNRYNAVMVQGCGRVGGTTTWNVTKVPLVIGEATSACKYVDVNAGGHLTTGPNVTMKFVSDGSMTVAAGGILTVDSTGYFTCISDDHVNDTNADGSATSPSVGCWRGIKYNFSGKPKECEHGSFMHYELAACSW